jgi:pyridoxamine 5'-phosphate oxidase
LGGFEAIGTETNSPLYLFFTVCSPYQIRIEGLANKISAEESDKYFNERPRENQIGAIVSHQSTVIAGREELAQREKQITDEFANKDLKRPNDW